MGIKNLKISQKIFKNIKINEFIQIWQKNAKKEGKVYRRLYFEGSCWEGVIWKGSPGGSPENSGAICY